LRRSIALLLCFLAPAARASARPDDGLAAKVEDLIKASGAAKVAVAYVDLASGKELYLRPDEVFHAASTMKLAVMAEVFRQADRKTLSLDDRIVIKDDFVSIADGSVYKLDPKDDSELTLYKRLGERETIRELIRLMITESSNLATNLLIDRVSARATTELMAELGAPGLKVLRGVEDNLAFARGMNNTATARGHARLLRLIADRKVVSPEASDAMVAVLLGQKFNEGIPAGLPAGTPVAHKTGSIRGAYHDAAIVRPAGRRPYVLVVMTRGLVDEPKAHRLVADIARAVYAHATAR
jgi:beta-lactamase class A